MRAPILTLLLVALMLSACNPNHLTREEVYDSENCAECHETHYDQWKMSMHAYAADDPVFLAMNRRGQEETNGELGTFCVNCHAPVAVREGLVEDGLELEEADFPEAYKGVTCAFCHLAVHEDDMPTSNNPLKIDSRLVMKGAIRDPVRNDAHDAEYSALLDRDQRESTDLCGPCHDIVLANGAHLESTFLEWEESVFAEDLTLTTCGNCHMRAEDNNVPIANVEGVPSRQMHDHRMAAVDVPITPWPGREEYTQLTQETIENTVRAELCIDSEPPGYRITVGLENVAAGHTFPSGASQDRRIWTEIKAYSGDQVIWESGVVAEGQPAMDVVGPDEGITLRDYLFTADGEEAHMFWEVDSVERDVLEGIRVFGVEEIRVWDFVGAPFTEPDRVELRMFARPIGLDVFDDLISSGHLDPALREEMPTFELTGTRLTWSGPPLGTCIMSDTTAQ